MLETYWLARLAFGRLGAMPAAARQTGGNLDRFDRREPRAKSGAASLTAVNRERESTRDPTLQPDGSATVSAGRRQG